MSQQTVSWSTGSHQVESLLTESRRVESQQTVSWATGSHLVESLLTESRRVESQQTVSWSTGRTESIESYADRRVESQAIEANAGRQASEVNNLSQDSNQDPPSVNQADRNNDEDNQAGQDLANAREADTESNDSVLVREHLAVHTWNVRSLKSLVNRDALTLHLERHQPEVLVATETWLDYKLTLIHQNY